MATTVLLLDRRYRRQDGETPIVIRINVFGKKLLFPTGVRCQPDAFSPTGGKNGSTWLTRGDNSVALNAFLRHRLSSAMDAVTEVSSHYSNKHLSISKLREKITCLMDGVEEPEPMLMETMAEFAELKQGRTKEIYLTTISKLKKHLKTDISLEEVNKAWLERFQAQELKYTSQNSVSIHLRNIRAVFNYAIDNELTQNYPFRRFKIKHQETAKRSLTIEQVRALLNADLQPYQVKYLDAFFLSFYLIGINPIDMLELKADNLRNGRIEYIRRKTHKPYSIKVEPEAMAIIKKYRGKDYLINPLDGWGHHNWLRRCDEGLKKIEGSRIEPGLTMYWARHTWATIAASLDIPKETIAAALGHEIGSKVTSIYINFDQRKVDAANRRVIDYVLGKQQPPLSHDKGGPKSI